MSHISVHDLRKDFGGGAVIDGVSFDIESGTFVTILGASGCGKTTTLRCLAGLEKPTSGRIEIGGRPVFDSNDSVFIAPEKRRIGMVFQSYGLWPHMTVGGNVGYPMRIQRKNRKDIAARVEELLAVVELGGYGKRSAAALSGGQQQRVALARALANNSGLVLYDEPLSNLDARLRASTRDQILSVHNRLGTTSVLVTHDQEEALTMSDHIIVMSAGRIEQVGTPEEIYSKPTTKFVAKFMGIDNVLAAEVVSAAADSSTLAVGGGTLQLDVSERLAVGSIRDVAFRASHVRVSTDPKVGEMSRPNTFSASVEEVVFAGARIDIYASVNDVKLLVNLLDGPDHRPKRPRCGDVIEIEVPAENIAILNDSLQNEYTREEISV